MKIQQINAYKYNFHKTAESKTLQSQLANFNQNDNYNFAYRDYNVSFAARLNRSPENFQDFNSENMPKTMKEYLLEDFNVRKQIHPTELQKNAYKWLNAATSVDDIKGFYDDEPLFGDLKSVTKTRATRGLLYKLRYLELNTKEPIFSKEFDESNKEDLTVYLVKKIYLEGKTLKEINEDFKKESAFHVKELLDGEKFTYADLSSLGVHFPKIAYWNSFQATRLDKDYNPSKRNGQYYKGFEQEACNQKGHVAGEETRKKLSESTTRWWASLSVEKRAEHIQKMLEGKEAAKDSSSDSVFIKFQGPIQTIAMDKVDYSQKLAQIYSEKYNDENFMSENEDFASRSRAIMLEFWNNDPKFKENYTQAYNDTMLQFEEAYADKENPQRLENLLARAVDIKNFVLENAKKRRQARIQTQKEMEQQARELQKHNTIVQPVMPKENKDAFDINAPKDVKRRFRTIEKQNLNVYPEMFSKELMTFLFDDKNIDFKTMQKIVILKTPGAAEILNLSPQQMEDLYEQARVKVEEFNNQFNFSHILISRTNDFIMNNNLFELTQNPAVFANERGDTFDYIKRHNLTDEFLRRKDSMNKEMKLFAKPLSDKAAKDFTINLFMPIVKEKLTEGFNYYNQIDTINGFRLFSEIRRVLLNDANEIKNAIKFLANYNASIKFLNDNNNDERAKDALKEHMVIDFANWFITHHPRAFM